MDLWGDFKDIQSRNPKRVKAAAYMVADGAPMNTSPELVLLTNINKYGVESVMGRTLGHNEILRMNTAESIVSAYNGRFNAKDWAKWAQENAELSKLLNESMLLAEEYGWS